MESRRDQTKATTRIILKGGSMAWIEFHIALRDHWKIDRLAFLMECEYPTALGYIACLWCWTASNAPNGNLSKFSDKELCKAARIPLEKSLKDVLKSVKLMDRHDRIHDWGKHGLRLLESTRSRVRKHREMKRISNVTETPTNQPNPTNRTLPNQIPIGGGKPAAGSFFKDDQMHDLKREIAKTMGWAVMSEAVQKASEEIIHKVKTSKKKLENPFGYAMGIAKKLNGVRV